MCARLTLLLAVALFSNAPLFAEVEEAEETSTDGRTFNLPGSEIDMLENTLNLDNVDLGGGPFKKLAAKWPEDLVVAPIPGYSPQLGWNLTLGGGYFLNLGDENSDTPA